MAEELATQFSRTGLHPSVRMPATRPDFYSPTGSFTLFWLDFTPNSAWFRGFLFPTVQCWLAPMAT